MPIPLFNSVASWFLKKRIHQIELFRKFPNEVQQEVLRKLFVYNIDTFLNFVLFKITSEKDLLKEGPQPKKLVLKIR